MTYSDSHCHLDSYPPEDLATVLDQMRVKHVDIVVSVGTSLETSEEAVRLAQSYDGVLAAVGIHPWNATLPTDEIRRRLYELTRREHVVAIGEIGLDYSFHPETKDIQKELLIYELSLAVETGLPVNIHCLEAHQDMMDILRKETAGSDLKGVIHGFSGDVTTLKEWLNLGFYIAVGVSALGLVRIANIGIFPLSAAVVRAIPLDRLLTETDSVARLSVARGIPRDHLPPQIVSEASEEFRGPADVLLVVEKLASMRGATIEEIANTTTANLKRLLKL